MRAHGSGRDAETLRHLSRVKPVDQELKALALASCQEFRQTPHATPLWSALRAGALRHVNDHLTAKDPIDGRGKRSDAPCLVYVPGRAALERLQHAIGIGIRAEHEYLSEAAHSDYLANQVRRIAPAEMAVDQAHIGLITGHGREDLGLGLGHVNGEIPAPQHHGQSVQEYLVLITDNDAGHVDHPPPCHPDTLARKRLATTCPLSLSDAPHKAGMHRRPAVLTAPTAAHGAPTQ